LQMIRYKQISLEERENIYKFLKSGISLTDIGTLLNHNKSTVSREISRNKSLKLGYLADRGTVK